MILNENLIGTYTTTEKGVERYETVWARQVCKEHILKYYSDFKQLNILMSGEISEIEKMRGFIQRCRDWSHGELPNINELQKIMP